MGHALKALEPARPCCGYCIMQNSLLLGVVLGTALSASTASADLMQACAEEIRTYCADVDRGRGRVSACLASHGDKLGSACLPKVNAVAQSRLVPGNVRKIFNPSFSAELPAACESAAVQLCSNVERGDGRIFACLYARTQQVGAACQADAQAVVDAS